MTLLSSVIRIFRRTPALPPVQPPAHPGAEQTEDPAEPAQTPAAPTEPLCVIGDIHGCADLLESLSRRIVDEVDDNTRIVCVGDYVDRGEASAAVLQMLWAEATKPGTRLTCLAGNHEDMLIGFLDAPEEVGPRWLRYGGLQTLASFGLRAISETMSGKDLQRARDELHQAMGPELEHWLRSLPLHVQSGNVAIVHAGADPDVPIFQQDRKSLLWGHAEFLRRPRADGIWVVHGHTVVPRVTQQDGRIAVDTGAYATGCLSAAILEPDGSVRQLHT